MKLQRFGGYAALGPAQKLIHILALVAGRADARRRDAGNVVHYGIAKRDLDDPSDNLQPLFE